MKKNYFDNLNYTFTNEDSLFELELLRENTEHVVCIAGSGSRVLPLFAKFPKQLTCVDTSTTQLYLTQLRIESLRSLEHDEFLAFWGYPPYYIAPDQRKILYKKISLSKESADFLTRLFEENNWQSILYIGKWEKTFARLSKINRLITGKNGRLLFEQKTPSNYYSFLKNRFPHKAWTLTVFLLGNAAVFNALLYKGSFPEKNIPQSFCAFYLKSFDKLFKQGPARNNFLLQILFFGKLIFCEGNPIECNPKIFSNAKSGIKNADIKYVQADILNAIEAADKQVNFVSMSDVPSYFEGETEKTFLQTISKNLVSGCVVVIRNYLHIPQNTNMSGYEEITQNYKNLIDHEKVQMYDIRVLRKL